MEIDLTRHIQWSWSDQQYYDEFMLNDFLIHETRIHTADVEARNIFILFFAWLIKIRTSRVSAVN